MQRGGGREYEQRESREIENAMRVQGGRHRGRVEQRQN